MKKKKSVEKKLDKSKKSVRKVVRKKTFSNFLPLFLLIFLILLTLIGLFFQKPPSLSRSQYAPPLPKQLVLRITITPIPEKIPIRSLMHFAKAEAAQETPDYCVNVPILFYHHVEPLAEAQKAGHAQFTVDSGVFDQQMHYLKEQGYITVSMDSLVDGIINKKSFSPKTVGLSFDDGYSDAHSYVYPILRKYGFIGNFAIATGLVDTPGYLSWDQLHEIARDPSVKIYNHTLTHTDLVGNRQLAENEIVAAQNYIQTRLGLRSNIFFYPFGSFDHSLITTLKTKGYIAGLTTLPGTLQCESSLMQLHRTRVGNAPLSMYGI